MNATKKIFRIIDRKTQKVVGSYSRAYHNICDFDSVESARDSNCHGMFKDKEKYAIAEYDFCEKLVNADVDNDEVKE